MGEYIAGAGGHLHEYGKAPGEASGQSRHQAGNDNSAEVADYADER